MYFDSLTMAAVAAELADLCLGGRVQRVVQTGPLGIGIEIYRGGRRHQLVLSAHPQHARVHLATEKVSRGLPTDTPMLLLLRKYVLGGRLRRVEHSDLERILVLSIAKEPRGRNEHDDGEPFDGEADEASADEALEPSFCEIVIEVMERRSNIILVGDDNIVLAAVKRVTAQMSSRQVGPGLPYTQPPRQDKLDPHFATADGIAAVARGSSKTLAAAIVGGYRGVSPQAAREAVFRATGTIEMSADSIAPLDGVAAALRGLFDPAARRPTVIQEGGRVSAYAAYEPGHLGEPTIVPSMSAAIDSFYTPLEGVTANRQRRDLLEHDLHDARARLLKQAENLQAELTRAASLDQLRWEGEMIFSYLHTMVPRQESIDVEGQLIALDPALTAVENAQARFKAYDKAKGALAGVPERLLTTEGQIAAIDELLVLARLAESYDQLVVLSGEAADAGLLRRSPLGGGKKARRQARSAPLSVRSSDGIPIFIGRSAGQNVEVTFKIGRREDVWLHTRQIPGAHVVVRADGDAVPERTIQEAAAYAAYYSGARDEAAVDVDVCRRRDVRRVPNGPLGLVTYRAAQTVRVAPRKPG